MLLMGTLAELIVKVVQEIYSYYVTIGKENKPMLYVKMERVI